MNRLKILSGGAAQHLIAGVAAKFEAATGWTIDGEFGAVGTMAAKLRRGQATDVIVLTSAIIDDLQAEGSVLADSKRDIGIVETALAVRSRDTLAPAVDADTLRNAFTAADAIFVPDTAASTAGIHVMKVLERLGIAEQVRHQLKVFPNGATAMRNLAASDAVRPIGCTQATEIIGTPGLTLVGALPDQFALRTIYTAAITAHTANSVVARTLIDLLISREQLLLRARAGFVETR